MALRGKGMLIVFAEVKPAHERDLDEWYNREHIDEQVNLPGFRRARRYVAVTGEPKYLATYECGTVGDLSDPRYLERLAEQTPWSRRVISRFTKFHRLTMRIRVDATHGIGGAVACLRFVPDPGRRRALTAWLREAALPAAVERPGMVGAFAAENDRKIAAAPAPAQGAAAPLPGPTEWAVMLEAGDATAVEKAARAVFTHKALAPFGVAAAPLIGTYQLVFGNER
jgi:hypothetical protein